MSTIVSLIGAAIVGLAIVDLIAWHRFRRELTQLRREVRLAQQHLEIQRLILDTPAAPPEPQRRHLRGLSALIPLFLALDWIKLHPVSTLAAVSGAVSSTAAVALLVQTGPLQPDRAMPEPHRPPIVGPAPTSEPTSPTFTTTARPTSKPPVRPTTAAPVLATPDVTTIEPPGTSPTGSPTATPSLPPITSTSPPATGRCVVGVELLELVDVCVGRPDSLTAAS